MNTRIFRLAASGAVLLLALAAPAADIPKDGWRDLNGNGVKDPYEDPALSAEKRAGDLLPRMTMEEKLGQLSQRLMKKDSVKLHGDRLRAGRVGSFLPAAGVIGDVALRNRLQKLAVEGSRLGIPFLFGFDSIHGFRTVFPIPLAQACAWDPELLRRTQEVSAGESAAAGVDWVFAPMVDVARDPRWGRIAEGFGEDPYLGGLCAAASVRGFQGDAPDPSDRRHVAACLKHYVAYGAAEGGRDYNTTDLSEYALRNVYLPPFRAGVDAGALTLMSAFNCLNGVPTSCNRRTLTDILRGEWGFRGFVVSDWESVGELRQHGVAADAADCARLALTAGVDMEMVSTTYADTLEAQVKGGAVPAAAVDEAVRRILRVKFQRGLFEHPYTDETAKKKVWLRPESLALAREAAAKSCVLLKNGKGILPLPRDGVKIALIGPLAGDKDELLGTWCAHGRAADVVPLFQGIRSKLGKGSSLTVVKGCPLEERRTVTLTDGSVVDDPAAAPAPATGPGFAEAVKAAAAADVVILAVGEPRGLSGENATRSTLGLTGRQEELFEAVAAAGKPVVAVLFNGRPLAVPRLQEKAAAILEAWHPGVQGGNAVADLLFGDAEPSGRLAVSFPRAVGQIPVHYNHLNTGRPQYADYRDCTHRPLYPFGFGLSYTTFRYGEVRLEQPDAAAPIKAGAPAVMKLGGTLAAAVSVANTGKRAGEETVQLYIRDVAASRARPVRELKGFRKVLLQPGETKEVRFTVTERELAFFDETGRTLVEPGAFELWLAPDSASGTPAAFTLVE